MTLFSEQFQPSSVTSYHGLAMYAVMIRCQKPYYWEQQMVVVVQEDHINRGRTTTRNAWPVTVVVVAHCRRQKSNIAAEAFVRVPATTLGHHGSMLKCRELPLLISSLILHLGNLFG